MIVDKKYWIILFSNGSCRLQLGVLKSLNYDDRENVVQFAIAEDGFENKYFNDKMKWYYKGEEVCTHDNKNIFEYEDLDKAYLAWLNMYGLNLTIIGDFVDEQLEEYPERFL